MAMVQAVIMFGSETWLLTPRLDKSLKGLHHWTVHQMAGMFSKRQLDKKWVYISIGEVIN